MTSRNRARLTWTLAIMIAALCVGSEQLHYLPGSGHAVRVGKVFLKFGLPQPDGEPCAGEDGPTVARPANRPFPIRDSNSCAICKQSSKTQGQGAAIDWESPPLLSLEKVRAARAPAPDRSSPRSFQSRAPPVA